MRRKKKPVFEKKSFDALVAEVLHALPENLKEALQTVQVVVQEEPTPEQLKSAGLDAGESLYGLFEGESLAEKRWGDPTPFPDRVILFQKPLQEDFPNLQDLKREIRITLLHELGHFFGMDEDDLEERGYR